MDLLISNSNLDSYAILDSFESLIWTDRYIGCGDFELYTKASTDLLNLYNPDLETYLVLKNTEHVMLIEDCDIKFDTETGNKIAITGRSLESILDRRIIWNATVLDGNLQNGIEQLLNDNAISPAIYERTIENLIFEPSTDPDITALTVKAQFTQKDNLYDVIYSLCKANNIGFKITLNDNKQFVFKLYAGINRSYDQLINPYVIFSKEFENLLDSSFKSSKKNFKNVALVYGEDKDTGRITAQVGYSNFLARREIFVDASNISQTVDNVVIPKDTYIDQLIQKGVQNLNEHNLSNNFDGAIDTSRMFKYGEDFFMGDIVQIVSDYGIENKARVGEMIYSQSDNGLEVYPTFEMIN